MRWTTFYYDLSKNKVFDFKVHSDKESALKCFNTNCNYYFESDAPFKADKLPAAYGHPTHAVYGVSARAFKKMFNCSIDEALKIAESEEYNE